MQAASSKGSLSALPAARLAHCRLCQACSPGPPHSPRRRSHAPRQHRPQATGGNGQNQQGKDKAEFGYNRKDILLLGFGLIALGYLLYYGLQALGVEDIAAGNYVQLFIFLGICLGYISTYFVRVAKKDTAYAQQLRDFEDRVISQRWDETPEWERERLLAEMEGEKRARPGQDRRKE